MQTIFFFRSCRQIYHKMTITTYDIIFYHVLRVSVIIIPATIYFYLFIFFLPLSIIYMCTYITDNILNGRSIVSRRGRGFDYRDVIIDLCNIIIIIIQCHNMSYVFVLCFFQTDKQLPVFEQSKYLSRKYFIFY